MVGRVARALRSRSESEERIAFVRKQLANVRKNRVDQFVAVNERVEFRARVPQCGPAGVKGRSGVLK